MRIVVTGACGFVGRALMARLRADGHDVLGTDQVGEPDLRGDIAEPELIEQLFAGRPDAVAHLATVPGGAAEQDRAAGKRINLDATMALAGAAAKAGSRFVFASSIAVFGDPMPPLVDDSTPLAPKLLYGAHKAMGEQWIETLMRRGDLSALALRLPGIVARPPGLSGMKSAFVSEVFHALAAHRPFVSPVSSGATMWLMSVDRVAANLAHALSVDATGVVTLPALRVTMGALVDCIAGVAGADPALVSYHPDQLLEAAFGRLPPLATPAAEAMGFMHDGDLAALVTKGMNQ